MTLARIAAALTVVAALALAGAQARGDVCDGPSASYGGAFDADTVETITGRVIRVDQVVQSVAPMRGICHAVRLLVRTPEETIAVVLGPTWYVERHGGEIRIGDRVHVRGSRVAIDGTTVIIATRIRSGSATLVLRSAEGCPVW